jgi:hypothetical protein
MGCNYFRRLLGVVEDEHVEDEHPILIVGVLAMK